MKVLHSVALENHRFGIFNRKNISKSHINVLVSIGVGFPI